jgi:DNA-binding PadR family transcriptional regulator
MKEPMDRELLLLGILRQHQMHGYQLVEFIEHNMQGWMDLKRPTTYFLLERMAAAGWIHYEQEQEGRRPLRRVYQLTPAGEEMFQTLLRKNLSSYAPQSFPNDIGIAFLSALPGEQAIALLRQREEALEQDYATLLKVPLHPGQAQWVLEHQARHLEAELEWVKEIIRRLENSLSTDSD